MRGRKVTLAHARGQLAKVGMTLRKYEGEYRVNFGEERWGRREAREDNAYYTGDISDALQTGLKMAGDAVRGVEDD